MACEPVVLTGGGFKLRTSTDHTGKGRIYLYAGETPVQSGATFYVMDGEVDLNPRTGQFQLKSRKARLRAVFAGQHLDVEVEF